MPFETLVDRSTVAAHLEDPDWLLFDCRFDLADPEAGRRAYRDGHLPGAVYVHLDDDLAVVCGAGRLHILVVDGLDTAGSAGA